MPRVGCVSYLNAKPLIDGLDAPLRLDVPSRLLELLEAGEVDVALCPVIDLFRSRAPLVVVPVGGICCDGPTLTVRLYSGRPIEAIDTVHADTDSHTSVALLRVVLDRLYGLRPTLVPYRAAHTGDATGEDRPQAMLLIGDKVVAASPPAVLYPHGLDLGEAWKRLTGLPFVFATWLARADAELGDLPARLDTLRRRNAARVHELADEYAPRHGWPRDLGERYLGSILRYAIGEREREAIALFGRFAAELGLTDGARPPRYWSGP